MSETDTRKLALMGRRRFVKTLSAFGLSGATLRYMTKDALAEQSNDLSEEVPYVAYLASENPDAEQSERRENGRAPIYQTLPYEQWSRNQAAHNAAKRVRSRLSKGHNTDSIGVGVVSDSSKQLSVRVTYPTIETPKGELISPDIKYDSIVDLVPETINGAKKDQTSRDKSQSRADSIEFEVEIVRTTEKQQAEFNSKYRPVPAGVQIGRTGISSKKRTVGTPAYSYEIGNTSIVTAGHFFGSKGSEEELAHQPKEPLGGGNRIGHKYEKVEGYYFDAAVMEVDSGIGCEYDIADNNGGTEGWPIDGIVTWSTIKNNLNTGYQLNLQGRATGRSTGELTETVTGSGPNDKTFRINVNSNTGDSGGPHFRKVTDSYGTTWTYIAGIHGWGTDSRATSMEAIENKFGLDVNSS